MSIWHRACRSGSARDALVTSPSFHRRALRIAWIGSTSTGGGGGAGVSVRAIFRAYTPRRARAITSRSSASSGAPRRSALRTHLGDVDESPSSRPGEPACQVDAARVTLRLDRASGISKRGRRSSSVKLQSVGRRSSGAAPRSGGTSSLRPSSRRRARGARAACRRLAHVLAGELVELLFGGDDVHDVVGELEGHAERHAEVVEGSIGVGRRLRRASRPAGRTWRSAARSCAG